MKICWIIALLIGQTLLFAAQPAEDKAVASGPNPPPQPPRAWLGLQVAKPDEVLTTQVPSLPPGVGFVIRSVNAGGPAQAAGLQEFDVLWKLGDQMLVNEGQLAALLRLAKPGDEITLAGFRDGKPLDVKLKLGDAPVPKRPFPGALADSAILQGDCGGPMRVINVADRLASYSTDEGRAEVRLEGVLYKVKINGPHDEVVYEGDLPADGNLDSIPEPWRRRIHALRRGLDHALDGRMMPSRQPRPRVVPPPGKNP
jgi:hypothetical protein